MSAKQNPDIVIEAITTSEKTYNKITINKILPKIELNKGKKYLGLKILTIIIINIGKTQRTLKTNSDKAVADLSSSFNFFLSKKPCCKESNILTILPPVLFKIIKPELI